MIVNTSLFLTESVNEMPHEVCYYHVPFTFLMLLMLLSLLIKKVHLPKSLATEFSLNLQMYGHFANQYFIQGMKIASNERKQCSCYFMF